MPNQFNNRSAVIALAIAIGSVMSQAAFTARAAANDGATPGGTSLLSKDENDVVIKTEELPETIRDYLAKEMPDSKITEARKDFGNKEHAGEKYIYEVDVTQGKKEYELKFDRDGKLLKKREEAGDDTNDTK